MKDTLRNKMPEAYYVKIAEMNIVEMLQKIPEIWKECGSLETPFQYKRQRYMKNEKYKKSWLSCPHHQEESPTSRETVLLL